MKWIFICAALLFIEPDDFNEWEREEAERKRQAELASNPQPMSTAAVSFLSALLAALILGAIVGTIALIKTYSLY